MTYSIAAHCPESNAFGIAITSSSICVPSRCAWVSPKGLVVTQNVTDPSFGPSGLAMLQEGRTADEIVKTLLASTPHGAWRQLVVIDGSGKVEAFSGDKAMPVVALKKGKGVIAMGNMLANDAVPQAMVDSFESNAGKTLTERLLTALEAGLDQGGETGEEHSAGLHVAAKLSWPIVDLRVDWHDEPIAELRRLWTLYRPQLDDYVARALNPEAAPAF
ncbi:DUF1028 domain-containing protein [Telmatospirillum sp. J64-1]|uniref:DUF1028 domain-containing protein n=1 Tax=Telmatospirillum sp. J64-1 TaxID=2502183 RepID=UPI00115C698F|nr:DUF1028 domain-containing protein [Telmatospirillum sp. J64-1]